MRTHRQMYDQLFQSVQYLLMCCLNLLDVVEFDNSFSYVRTKKIRYLIVVEPPK